MGNLTKVFLFALFYFVVSAFLRWIFGAEDWLLESMFQVIPLSFAYFLGIIAAD